MTNKQKEVKTNRTSFSYAEFAKDVTARYYMAKI